MEKNLDLGASSVFSEALQAVMCIQLVERYAVCRCFYHRHAVDACPSYPRRGHTVTIREILVGYTCENHSVTDSPHSRDHKSSNPAHASRTYTNANNADG